METYLVEGGQILSATTLGVIVTDQDMTTNITSPLVDKQHSQIHKHEK